MHQAEEIVNNLSYSCYTIFLFHGVIPEQKHRIKNYSRKHINLKDFHVIIKSLVKKGYPLRMNDYLSRCRTQSELPPYSFSVTFDDGFLNNYIYAAPILEEQGVPTIFYATSDFIQYNYMSWIDKIEYALEFYKPHTIKLPWVTDAYDLRSLENEIRFLDECRSAVKYRQIITDIDLVNYIYGFIDRPVIMESNDITDKKMEPKHLQLINNNNLFSVGAHTKTHPILSRLNQVKINSEITDSVDYLRRCCKGSPVEHFSYPEGFIKSFDSRCYCALQKLNIITASTTIDGSNSIKPNFFKLKRKMI